MKIWNEKESDVFSYFQWFDKDECHKRTGRNVNLGVFSVNSSEMFNLDDRREFIDACSKTIKRIFVKYEFTRNYRLYLFANVEIKNKNSQIEKYKKVWKLLQSKWNIDGFNKGPEIEMEVSGKTFFSSIAEVKKENILTALEIVSSNPKRYTIIASKKEDILSNKVITYIFGMAFNRDSGYMNEIDYFNLSINLCQQGNMVFRWGESSEEAEIAIILRRDIFRYFSDYGRIEIS